MKTLHVCLSAIIGGVVGMALYKFIARSVEIPQWLVPFFTIIPAVIGALTHDPKGMLNMIEQTINDVVKKNKHYVLKRTTFWFCFFLQVSVQLVVYYPAVRLLFSKPITVGLVLGPLLGGIAVVSFILLAVKDTNAMGPTGIESRDYKILGFIFLSLTPVGLAVWTLIGLTRIPYGKLAKFFLQLAFALVANFIIFVRSSHEMKSVAAGASCGFLCGYTTDSYVYCALAGVVSAAVMIWTFRIQTVASWALEHQKYPWTRTSMA